MTICCLIECIHNNRKGTPRCKEKTKVEIGEDRKCIHFKPDYEYLKEEFRKRHKIVALKNLEKAKGWNQREPPMAAKAEALRNSARKFLLRENEK